jgi:hypothetical protein
MPKAIFKANQEEDKSTWTVNTHEGELTVSIAELFPSGKYDVHEVRSKEFGESLIKRLENNAESVLMYLLSNNRTMNVSDALPSIDDKQAFIIVGEFVPLNDAEREFRDEMKEVCRGC